MESVFSKLLKYIHGLESSNRKIVRDDESRRETIYEYFEYALDKQIKPIDPRFHEIVFSREAGKTFNIYGIDSSSRVIDTPYIFLAVGASTSINRLYGRVIDYPDINKLFSGENSYRYIVIVPEITGFSEDILDSLKRNNIIVENPAGLTYTPEYSKLVILDELRLSLENRVLEIMLNNVAESDSIIFLDGPIYYTPPLIYQVNEYHGVRDELFKQYVDSWKILVNERINLVNKLWSKGVRVVGVVKRLSRSNILSKIDPYDISRGRLNDEAYLTVITTFKYRELEPKPYYIGPIKYDPGLAPYNLPAKTLYYLAIPRRKAVGETDYRNYVFYRVEAIHDDNVLEPIIYDSVSSGSTLPLSILLADKRVKKITIGLLNYVSRLTGLYGESTHQYISF